MAAIAFTANIDKHDLTTRFDTDSGKVGVDDRCSACISPFLEDFEGPLDAKTRKIKGFGGSTTGGAQLGTIVWKWCDDEGVKHTFRIPNSYYVPQAEYRLLSPQHWAQSRHYKRERTGADTNGVSTTLYWLNADKMRRTLTIPLGRIDNVATFYLAEGFTKFAAFCTEVAADIGTENDPTAMPAGIVSDDEYSVASDDDNSIAGTPSDDGNQRGRNLQSPTTDTEENHKEHETPTPDSEGVVDSEGDIRNEATELDLNFEGESPNIIVEEEEDKIPDNPVAELLRYHQRYDHLPMSKLQAMAKQGILPRKLAKCAVPACSACMFAKAEKRPWRQKSVKNRVEPRKAERPGEVVSVDQLKSPTTGLIAQMTGILTKKRYLYATVFVDQYSGLGYVHLQKTQSAEETVEGKIAFERYSARHGARVLNYHADNGIFRAHKWVEHCQAQNQGLTFAAVGAHHTNGLAERRIKELQAMTRASMIFAAHRWNTAITANLWPYAMRMANASINEAPRMSDKMKRSPEQIFSNSVTSPNSKHQKPFGCPVYVLDSRLQGNKPFGKWDERSKVGIYLGRSPHHPRNVALVLSLVTGLVSPQFHVKFDSSFSTVKEIQLPSKWQLKAGFVSERESSEKQKSADKKQASSQQKRKRSAKDSEASRNKKKNNLGEDRRRREVLVHEPPTERDERDNTLERVNPTEGDSTLQRQPESVTFEDKAPSQMANATQANPNQEVRYKTSNSGRVRKPVQRLVEAMKAQMEAEEFDVQGEIFCLQALFPDSEALDEIEDPLQAYKATADPDTMYMHEALKEPDRAQFIQAMDKEVKDQMENGNFTIVDRNSVPKDHTIFRAVWQMKRKRDIRTREVKKWKARLNLDGSTMTKGKHYEFTYAPVARWNSIRLLLAMSALHNWHTTQIDYVLAFPQAPVERELYMEVPKGFEIEGGENRKYVLKLNRNVYGQKSAGRVWNSYLSEKLIKEVGFTQSKTDECVYFRGNVIYALYTDDSILASPSQKEIDKVIEDIRKAKLNITVEGDIKDFLGVNIERKDDGTIHLTQPHLIDSILEDLRMKDDPKVKPRDTPASSSKLFTKFPDSEPFDGSFHYRRVIGKLNYLEKGSRSDIAYIVHQCARFVESPKKEHGEALRWLGRYLKNTRDQGTIYRPDNTRGLEVFVDASFCQDWNQDEAQDRDTARSRYGFYIMYAGCPLQWRSQLLTEVCLSTTESEYCGLSYALRDAIPMMSLLSEYKENGIEIIESTPKVHCKVFEDNSGALEIAREHKYRPRTKHINVKYHHFRDYVERKEISIHKIDTKLQLADILTKAVNLDTMERLRKIIMGW